MSAPAGYLVVANAGAGSTEREVVDGAVARLAAQGPTEVAWTDDAEDLDRAIGAVDDRVLVVAGGDGSLHLAAQRLDALGALGSVVVALVPLGTGNDLARTLDLVDRPAGDGLADGREVGLDLLRDDRGTLVVNMAHLGLGAVAGEQASRFKATLGPAAYPVGTALAAVRSGPWTVQVVVDGEVLHDGPVLAVAVANGATVGGGTPFAPGADPTDGVLEVVVLPDGPLPAQASLALALRRGDHLDRDEVGRARGSTAEITGAAPANVDGELEPERHHHRYEVVPGALRLRLPGGAWIDDGDRPV